MNENIELHSELVLHTEFDGEGMDFHLVSYMDNGTERYGIWIETYNGSAMIATLEENVDINVAVSLFVALGDGVITGGSKRAIGILEESMTDTMVQNSDGFTVADD